MPPWLPTVAIASGFIILSIGMSWQYYTGIFEDWDEYSRLFGTLSVICFTCSMAGATYIEVLRHDLVLLFVFFTFMSGRIIQGAISARLLQKVLDFVLSSSSSATGLSAQTLGYLKYLIKNRIVLFIATGIITLHTLLSILSVFVVGTGEPIDAIERFWIGFFFLIIVGLVFDFRHFAHRISWTASIGLVIATTGAFLYSPVGFSTYTAVLAPYLQNPIPDWMRFPLGSVGFIFGVIMWAVFYIGEG